MPLVKAPARALGVACEVVSQVGKKCLLSGGSHLKRRLFRKRCIQRTRCVQDPSIAVLNPCYIQRKQATIHWPAFVNATPMRFLVIEVAVTRTALSHAMDWALVYILHFGELIHVEAREIHNRLNISFR